MEIIDETPSNPTETWICYPNACFQVTTRWQQGKKEDRIRQPSLHVFTAKVAQPSERPTNKRNRLELVFP